MVNKKILMLVLTASFLISFLSLTSAAVRLELANQSNISGSAYFLNASITGLTGNVNIRNISFYYQPKSYAHNETWTLISFSAENDSVNQSYFNTTWDTTAVADGTYTINVTSWNYDIIGSDIVNATNSSSGYVGVTIDNTPPTVAVYGTAPAAYANGTSIKTSTSVSNNLTLSILVTDATIGIANQSRTSVCFVSIGGGINHTIPMFYASRTTGWCNASDTNASTATNISGLADGNQTIDIYVNDTITNLINSTLVVQIDTTAPTATAKCSPATVNTGDSFPCTCTGSDATSGLNTATGSSTSGSITSTSKTGTFTYTCTAEDNGGLTAAATATYSVEQFSSPSSGGGTTSTWTTQTLTETVFENGYTGSLGAKSRFKVPVDSQDHYVGVVSISGNSATIEVSSTPVQFTLSAGEEKKVDVTDDGFYDIDILMNGIANNKANITIEKIHEEIPASELGTEDEDETPAESSGSLTWLWVLIAIIVLVVIGSIIGKSRGKKK